MELDKVWEKIEAFWDRSSEKILHKDALWFIAVCPDNQGGTSYYGLVHLCPDMYECANESTREYQLYRVCNDGVCHICSDVASKQTISVFNFMRLKI